MTLCAWDSMVQDIEAMSAAPVAPASLADVSDITPKASASAMDLKGVPLDALFAMADLYATGARHFEAGAFWPKLFGGAQRPGQSLIIAEGDRLSLAFHSVADEISRRDPGSDDTLIDQRGEWLMRAAVHDGGWEKMTKIVSETRAALGIEGDPDREDGGDAEPSLGAPEHHHASQIVWLRGSSSDTEQDAAQ